jgi:hypothetical protein
LGGLLRIAAPVHFNPGAVAAEAVVFVVTAVWANDCVENTDNEIKATAVASPIASNRL